MNVATFPFAEITCHRWCCFLQLLFILWLTLTFTAGLMVHFALTSRGEVAAGEASEDLLSQLVPPEGIPAVRPEAMEAPEGADV